MNSELNSTIADMRKSAGQAETDLGKIQTQLSTHAIYSQKAGIGNEAMPSPMKKHRLRWTTLTRAIDFIERNIAVTFKVARCRFDDLIRPRLKR